MGTTIGTSDLEKNVKKGSASGHVLVKGFVATDIDKPKMTAVDKAAAPDFAAIVDSRGEKRLKKIPRGDRAAAEKSVAGIAMKNAGATCYLAQKAGSSDAGDVYKLLGSFKRD